MKETIFGLENTVCREKGAIEDITSSQSPEEGRNTLLEI